MYFDTKCGIVGAIHPKMGSFRLRYTEHTGMRAHEQSAKVCF